MRLFSRNQEAVPSTRGDDAPFEALRRSPRNARKVRSGATTGSSTDFDAGVPLDPARASKTRARRRLIGAIALALAAIVFVPMLFDRTPVAPPDDIGLQIPDRDTPFEGRRGIPDGKSGPLRPSTAMPATSTSGPPAAPAAPSLEAPAVPEPIAADADRTAVDAKAPTAKPVDKSALVGADKATTRPVEKAADKSADKPHATTDDPRALAALEGRPAAAGTVPAAPTPTDAAASRGFAVQIAAYTAADRARAMRDQLVAGGLKSYTESVSTAQGMRTRVRLGPFATREAADHAKQKLKTMKLDGSVVPL